MRWYAATLLFLWMSWSSSASMAPASMCPDFPTCECQPVADKFNVMCRSVGNLTDIRVLLEKYFTQRSIYVMTLRNCSVTSLPNGIFDNFSIFMFSMNCPFLDIEAGALQSVFTFEQILLYDTQFTKVPAELRNLTHLTTLNLIKCNVTELTTELKDLKSLSHLTVTGCEIQNIAEDAFSENVGLLHLDVSKNKLHFIPEDTFDPLINLISLSLQGNQLHSLDGLFKKLNPLIINAYDNNVTNVDLVFPHRMKRLITLDLGKNPIPFLKASALAKLPNLQSLRLIANKFTALDPKLLQNFIQLTSINLAYNKITTIPDGFFLNLLMLQEIDLSHNKLISVEGAFSNNPKLQTLQLQYNDITTIKNAFYNLPQLTVLNFKNNFLMEIRDGHFSNTPNLEDLDLDKTFIHKIHSKAFIKLTNLKKLRLNLNKFRSFNYSVRSLYSLTNLSAANGLLYSIAEDEMTNLPKLKYLHLVNNGIVQVNGAFRQLFSLTYLNLAKNKLVTLSRDTFPEQIKLEELYLGSGNKFYCDCRLTWFVEWLNDTGRDVLKDVPYCHLPRRFQNIPIRNLTADQLTVWPDKCPEPCDCRCRPKDRDRYVEALCSDRNLTDVPGVLPDYLGNLDLRGNLLESFAVSRPEIIDNLLTLSLSDNRLRQLNTSLPKSLSKLSLDGNLFTRFPLEAIGNKSSLDVLRLSRNPWMCDCDTLAFKRWLIAAGEMVVDVNDTRCGEDRQNGILLNRVIIHLKDEELCPTKISLYVFIAIGTLLCLFLGVSLLLVYHRNKLYINVWLYAHGLTWVKEDDVDTDKEYDAFICYVGKDRNFALMTIVSGLETGDPRYNICVPERNLLAGVDDVVVLTAALAACKRIIVILSKAYLDDQFAMQAFRNAFSLSLKDKVNRLVVIQRGRLPALSSMDPVMKTVLEATRPIVWREKMFWERLRYAMPKKRKDTPGPTADFTASEHVPALAGNVLPGEQTPLLEPLNDEC